MKSMFNKIFSGLRRMAWTFLVALMIALHNFYKNDNQTPESFGKQKHPTEIQADGADKD